MILNSEPGQRIAITIRYLDTSEVKVGARLTDAIGLFRRVHCVGAAGPGAVRLIFNGSLIRGGNRTLEQV